MSSILLALRQQAGCHAPPVAHLVIVRPQTYRMKSTLSVLLLAGLFSYANAANPKQEFNDPAGDRWWQVSPEDFMPAFDATKLTIERLEPGVLRFTFTMAAPIPADLPNEAVMFRLYLDLDRDIKTGQDWSLVGKHIGSDLAVDLMWYNGKWIIMPEELTKQVTHEIKGNTVTITITDPRFAKIERFNMFAWVNGLKGNMDVLPNEGFYEVSLPIKP